MSSSIARRSFLASSWTLALLAPSAGTLSVSAQQGSEPAAKSGVGPAFPSQDPDLVREMVVAAHGNVAKVKQLVGRRQTLAKATYDWGFGDWETALGGASHVGNREIAEYLIANGARPSIFSAAMLGQLDVVKAFISTSPGVQTIKGPHSITLLRHAMAGGAQAKPVVEYLTQAGGADERLPEKPTTADERTKLAGTYVFGSEPDDRLNVTIVRESIQIQRPSAAFPRNLNHLGSFEFYPAGAENVRVRFSESASGLTLTIHDPDVVVTARKA